jgi:Domain of unknown function (DUF4136)
MRINWQLPAILVLCLIPLASMAQDVVPYAQTDVKVDWVRGTDFSKYSTYAWGTSRQQTPDPVWNQRYIDDIDAALSAKGLHKVEMDANPSLIVAYDAGSKPTFVIQGYRGVVKQGTFIVELVDPQLKKAVWWGIANDVMTDKPERDVPMVQKKIATMFKKYPPPKK